MVTAESIILKLIDQLVYEITFNYPPTHFQYLDKQLKAIEDGVAYLRANDQKIPERINWFLDQISTSKVDNLH